MPRLPKDPDEGEFGNLSAEDGAWEGPFILDLRVVIKDKDQGMEGSDASTQLPEEDDTMDFTNLDQMEEGDVEKRDTIHQSMFGEEYVDAQLHRIHLVFDVIEKCGRILL